MLRRRRQSRFPKEEAEEGKEMMEKLPQFRPLKLEGYDEATAQQQQHKLRALIYANRPRH